MQLNKLFEHKFINNSQIIYNYFKLLNLFQQQAYSNENFSKPRGLQLLHSRNNSSWKEDA